MWIKTVTSNRTYLSRPAESRNLERSLTQKTAISKPGKHIRILVAKPGLDGHDRGALILCRAFRDAGMEVIYTGFLATPEQVAQMAIDEDVDVVAMSLLNGAHMTAFPKVAKLVREKGGDDILLVGGGIIPDDDKPRLEKLGITGNYGPGTPLKTIIEHVQKIVKERDSSRSEK
jgi:methylmalonyl-CoA mutase, C-terminal domain